MTKRRLVAYGNCQIGAACRFLERTPMAEHFTFQTFLNYQLILGEASKEDMFRAASKADCFLFQPTGEIYGILGTEELCASVVPKDAQKISASYIVNSGFFPIAKHGRWWTGESVIEAARLQQDIVDAYDKDILKYDCERRFHENLSEQMRRERECDIKMGRWILDNHKTVHMFLLCNHPSSALLVELARRVLRSVNPDWDCEIPFEGPNDCQLPGHHAVHASVIRELGLSYDFEAANRGADFDYYRVLIQELAAKKGEI